MRVVALEFEPHEADVLFLADGCRLDDWIAHTSKTGGADLEHYLKLVNEPRDNSNGRLLAAAKLNDRNGGVLGPIVLYDGWHRAAAWKTRINQHRSTSITSYLIITEDEDCELEFQSISAPSNNSLDGSRGG